MRFSRKAKWVTGGVLFAAALPILCFGSAAANYLRNQPPWYNRGQALKPIPYTVVVGPVDADRGIVGFLEPEMLKSDVWKNLSTPLVKRLPVGTAPTDAIPFPEDANADFFGSVFAWVQYGGSEDRVISIEFDLAAFHEKFGGDQRVLLQYRGKNYLLHRGLKMRDLRAEIKALDPKADVRVQTQVLVLGKTGTSLNFDSNGGGLRSVWVIAMFDGKS